VVPVILVEGAIRRRRRSPMPLSCRIRTLLGTT